MNIVADTQFRLSDDLIARLGAARPNDEALHKLLGWDGSHQHLINYLHYAVNPRVELDFVKRLLEDDEVAVMLAKELVEASHELQALIDECLAELHNFNQPAS